ncbi:MAG: hypothetical protein QOG33_2860 [Gaiellales bacterium]|jgi:hypothetical protein|nr:hypothetical protein [Gaiellales bacterium]
MATRQKWAVRLGMLAVLAVVLAYVGSATAGTAETVTHDGFVSQSGVSDTVYYPLQVSAGDSIRLQLNWPNAGSNLQLFLLAPDGSVLVSRPGHRHPKQLSYVATTSGTFGASVKAAKGSSQYSLTVTIAPNQPPVAADDVASTSYETAVAVDPLANDSDPNGDALSVQNFGTSDHGTVNQLVGGNLNYTPAAGFSGDDRFGYTVCDNRTPRACSFASVVVHVDAPVAPPTVIAVGGSDGFAPAPQMVTPTVIPLHVGDDILRLDDSKDYILQMPAEKKTGALVIRGGRNVEVIGGYMSIATASSVGAGAANIVISDGVAPVDGRVVRIEGVQIDASSGVEADGIRIDAPHAVVQVVNTRITGLLGSLATTHADLIQPWGGVKELDVDGFTGASHYNSFYLRRENNPLLPPIGKVVMHDVNVYGLSNPAGSDPPETISAISIGTQPYTPSDTQSTTNCQVAGTIQLDNFYALPASKRPGSFVYPRDSMTTSGCPAQVSADGTSVDWPSLRASSGGTVTGVVRVGAPPGGDFVPLGMAGLGYVAPQ